MEKGSTILVGHSQFKKGLLQDFGYQDEQDTAVAIDFSEQKRVSRNFLDLHRLHRYLLDDQHYAIENFQAKDHATFFMRIAIASKKHIALPKKH